MKNSKDNYVQTLDMKNDSWREFDFSSFDVVYHVAGIAHVSSKKKLAPLYFKVNRDLAIDTAIKAKESGVKQFIFMSSMIIYGKDNKIRNFKHVDTDKYAPINAYGQSKLDADLGIQKLQDDIFKVAIIRTPVVYGPNCKGNFPRLHKLALKLPLFPNINNQRSMIFIDNLSLFISYIIANKLSGVFYPQNLEYVNTKDIIKYTREIYGKKYRETKLFNPLIFLLGKFIPTINKVFGNKTYNQSLSLSFDLNYTNLLESLKKIKDSQV